MNTNLVKWFLKIAYAMLAKAENARTTRMEAIKAEKILVLNTAILKRAAIEKQLEAMRKTAEDAKIKADEKANNRHEILEGEFTELENF